MANKKTGKATNNDVQSITKKTIKQHEPRKIWGFFSFHFQIKFTKTIPDIVSRSKSLTFKIVC